MTYLILKKPKYAEILSNSARYFSFNRTVNEKWSLHSIITLSAILSRSELFELYKGAGPLHLHVVDET